MIYYRVACKKNCSPEWRWLSTQLTSLEALFCFLRIYRVVAQDHLRVFSSTSLEELNEQLSHENDAEGSASVTAAQFLHERGIRSTEMTQTASAGGTQEHQGRSAMAITSVPPLLSQDNAETHTLYARNIDILERRRREMEWGAGGDHDLPYAFALPDSWPQIR